MTTSTPRPPVRRATPSVRLSAERSMTSAKPRARACSALAGLVVVEIAFAAPCALIPQYQRRRRSRVPARQDGVVQWGDACCCDPDKYPPISPTRSWHLDQLQPSVPRERLRAHRSHHDFSVSAFATADVSRRRHGNDRSAYAGSRFSVGDMGTLSQAAAEGNVLARRLVERDEEIVGRDSGR